MAETYYRYHDDDINKDFYYNADSQQTVWEFPTENAVVYDPDTMEVIPPPPPAYEETPYIPEPVNTQSQIPEVETQPEIPAEQSSMSSNDVMNELGNLISHYAGISINFQNISNVYFHPIKDFKYSDQPLKDSIIVSLTKPQIKIAVQFSKMLSKVVATKKLRDDSLLKLIQVFKDHPEVYDEIFVQLWKQTTHAPHSALDVLMRIFLTFSTLFTVTKPFHEPILHHLAKMAKSNDYARFIFLRFYGSCLPMEVSLKFDDDAICDIQKHPVRSAFNFEVTLWEVLLHQQKTYPQFPVPICMHQMANQIKNLNGLDTVGIFRLPGNMKQLDELIAKSNSGEDFLDGVQIETLASLFKRFFRDIPGKLIHPEMVTRIMDISSYDDAQGILNDMEYPCRLTLTYLIGFLREVATHAEVNKMHAKNLAMVFGPNIVCDTDKVNLMQLHTRIQFFIESLIENLDVTGVYPLPNI